MKLHPGLLVAAALALPGAASAEGFTGSDYKASDLLKPCLEADSDARDGVFSEVECEQYILGFVDAAAELGAAGQLICPPAVNTADEVRWAYTRWVYGSFSERREMPASEALLATLKEAFPCGN